METRFNVKVWFTGAASFEFQMPEIGKVKLTKGKDIYIKGLSQRGVELLRQLRPLHVEHKLNEKQDGCFRVIDVYQLLNVPLANRTNYTPDRTKVIASAQSLKKQMIHSEGPLSMDEILGVVTSAPASINPPTPDLTTEEVPSHNHTLAGLSQQTKVKAPDQFLTTATTDPSAEPTVITANNPVLTEETKLTDKEPEVKLEDYVVKSGANYNKKLKDLSIKDLKKTLKYAPNKEDKAKAEEYLKIVGE